MSEHRRLLLLNAAILTSYGEFKFERIKLDEARQLIRDFVVEGKEIVSAIGHASTAEILSELFEYPVQVQRVEVEQTPTDVALVFRLKGRLPEGKVLTRSEIEQIGYEFGRLEKLDAES
ncbi:DUF1874 domain-containing protein [Candidatus Parcubacteria bacterium]|nr:MAG: DUF1874 domain-containing protein [Candidatus Parcubacteria bacterium]